MRCRCNVLSLVHVVIIMLSNYRAQAQPINTSPLFLSGVRLIPDDDASPTASCSTEHVLSAEVDSLHLLPNDAFNYTVAVSLSLSSSQSDATLFTFAGVRLSVNMLQGQITLSTQNGDSASYGLAGGNTTISIAVAQGQSLRICFGFFCPAPSTVTGFQYSDASGWISLPASNEPLHFTELTLGSKAGKLVADATVHGLWVFPAVVAFDEIGSSSEAIEEFLRDSTILSIQGPDITVDGSPSLNTLVVGRPVQLTVRATSTASKLGVKLRLTFYGMAPSDCQERSCGDVVSEFYAAGGAVQGTSTVSYSRAGRYILRAQASDLQGGWSSKYFELIVRKVGDSQATAPCCRTTANIIAQQLGRPIDTTSFRPAWINVSAAAVGWDFDYLMGPEDMEAERLFDYGLLAPVETGPIKVVTCADRYLAGPGSQRVWGVTYTGGIDATSNLGRNKRVAILPQGFSWATDTAGWNQQLPTCVTHWSSWIATTPYGRLAPNSQTASCSYTCTPDGVQQLVTKTGTYDRFAEAIIENTYGLLSLQPDPVVLPTLYMPKGATAGQNAYTYSEGPIQAYMRTLGYDMQNDFHTVLVLSPLPRFINPGYTAWSDAGGSPLIFVMRCNPQHYYLVHEIGHRLGMNHATVYKLEAGPEAQAPTSPLGPGVMEDTYTDRLDIMACCKGDYSLHNRILSGWVPGRERVTLGLADIVGAGPAAASAGGISTTAPVVRRYMLWPYDRAESKGQLKGITLRLEDGKVLVLGYRSTPFWQAVRIGRNSSSRSTEDRILVPEHMRTNVAGLSVEYSKRYLDAAGASTWSVRGLLDFNLAFSRYPDALPSKPGGYPPDPPGAAFTLLREGDAWLDEEHNVLVAVERIVPCTDKPLVPVHKYGVFNFYGFRGENPGEESVKRADYTGYADGINCMQLRVVTGVANAPGTLDVKVRMQGLDEQDRLILGGEQCGFPVTPQLQLVLPDGVDIISTVWRDNLNRTVALDSASLKLPPLAPLTEASVADSEQCNSACDWQYHVKVLAADGAQTQMDISIGTVSLSTLTMTVTYSYYLKRSILQTTESHSIPVVQQAAQRPSAPQGRQLLSQAVDLETAAQQVFGASVLPDFSCSKQWTVTANLLVPSTLLDKPSGGSTKLFQLMKVCSGAGSSDTPGWPTVFLKVTESDTYLMVQWGSSAPNARQQPINIAAANGWTQLAVVRDGDRLGVFANSQGGFLLDNVWCVPDSQEVNYCSKAAPPADDDGSFRSLRLGDPAARTGITVESVRVYNYAIPRLSLAKEAVCMGENSCGRFMVAGWQLPPAASVPPGDITLYGTVPAVASTPISLKSSAYYLLVGPWGTCSARCGGGWATRDVRCMQLDATTDAPVNQVPLDDCPLDEDIPASSKQCNTVACPQHTFQVLASKQSTCGKGCQAAGSQGNGAQLVCINSLGQPQPLGQCCTLCNNTDWSAVMWSNDISRLLQPTVSSLGRSVRVLQPDYVPVNSSLEHVVTQGLMSRVCATGELCSSAVKWKLSPWSACSTDCGGGIQTRSASCVSISTGAFLADSLCTQTLGPVPSELLTAECGNMPCSLYTWQVGPWSTCSGDAAFGISSRVVTCVDRTGTRPPAGDSACRTPSPSNSAVCLRAAKAAVCTPSFVPQSLYNGQDCWGHGACSMTGCVSGCRDGWHGQFCEIPAKCSGIMDRADKCCPSGVVDVAGGCCPSGAVLDKAGLCCKIGRVDVCGNCGGSNWTVDLFGSCCSSVLDAFGVCCTTGALDECGVCNGDGTSCSVKLRLLLELPLDANVTASTTTAAGAASDAEVGVFAGWQAALQRMMHLALPPALSGGVQLQMQQVTAEWAPAALATNQLLATRHLLSGDANAAAIPCNLGGGTANCIQPEQERERWSNLFRDGSDDAVHAGHCQHHDVAILFGSVCGKDNAAAVGQGADKPSDLGTARASDGADAGASRKLLQGPSASSWRPAYVEVLLMPTKASTLSPSGAAGSAAVTAEEASGVSIAALGYTLVSGLQQQQQQLTQAVRQTTGQISSSAASDAGVQFVHVLTMQRQGVCGNGICEVGERALMNEGVMLHDADNPCPKDCPFTFSMCPAPVGPAGAKAKECGGNGRCIRSQGVCDCFAGYTGDACEQCLASFYPHAGRCVPQYIAGRTVLDPLGLESEEAFVGLVFLVIGSIAAATALASFAWVLWLWLVHGRVPKSALFLQKLVLRVRTALGGGGGGAGGAAPGAASRKYLLDDELELSAAAAGAGRKLEDAAVWSKHGSLRRRSAIGSNMGSAEGYEGDGDLLKAIRANMLEEPTEAVLEPTITLKARLSRTLFSRSGGGSRYSSFGGAGPGSSGRGSRYSSLAGMGIDEDDGVNVSADAFDAVGATPTPSSAGALAKTFSDVYSSMQRGMSEAGRGLVRMVSNSVSRLTSLGSGYERVITDEDGMLLLEGSSVSSSQQLAAGGEPPLAGGVRRSRAALDVSHGGSVGGQGVAKSGAGASRIARHSYAATLPSAEHAAAAAEISSILPDWPSTGQRVPVSQLLGPSGATAAAAGDAWALPMPRLARIKTRAERRSDSGSGAAAAESAAAAAAWKAGAGPASRSDGGAAVASSVSNLGSLSGRTMQAPGAAGAGAAAVGPHSICAGAASVAAGGARELGGAPSWRTRADYHADLVSSTNHVMDPHLLQQARGRKSPSEPGQQRVRDKAGLPVFISTPLSGSDATNRNAVEAFGQRMESWFSPHSGTSSGNTSSDGAWSRGSTATGAVEQAMAMRRAAAAAATAAAEASQAQGSAAQGPIEQPANASGWPVQTNLREAAAVQPSAVAAPSPAALSSQAIGSLQATDTAGLVLLAHDSGPTSAHGQQSFAAGLITSATGSGSWLPDGQPSNMGGNQGSAGTPSAVAATAVATPGNSQPGTPGAIEVAVDQLPSLASEHGAAAQSPAASMDGQQEQLQQSQRQQHPWQAQASSGTRIVSFKAWHSQPGGKDSTSS